MPGNLLHVGVTAQCPHAGQVTTTPTQTRLLVAGQPVATTGNLLTVGACPFQIPVGAGTKPQPCVKVQWLMPATRVLAGGQPVLLQPGPGTGSGMCQSVEQIPQGPPTVSQIQPRASGT
jgi:hypothetical protein